MVTTAAFSSPTPVSLAVLTRVTPLDELAQPISSCRIVSPAVVAEASSVKAVTA
jgi:hypothetical protein